MITAPETVRQVLRSWLAIEVLTPQVTKEGWSGLAAEKQGQQRNRRTAAPDDPGQWEAPADDDLTPWPILATPRQQDDTQAQPLDEHAAPDPDQPRPWYSIVLGALPAKQALHRLDATFSDAADEDETHRRTQGYIIAATLVLDEWGVMVPDTLALVLRDLVAHALVSRAEALASLDDPRRGLAGLDLMDFAVVVASSNNTAVENISLELPVRDKALDASLWRDPRLDYFSHTADAVLDVPTAAAEKDHAWGLMAAKLGSTANRRAFFRKFWWDADWRLNDWLDLAGWPDTQRQSKPLGKLAKLVPPPRAPEAKAEWRRARDAFRQMLKRCHQLRDGLEVFAKARLELAQVEAQLPAAEERLNVAGKDLASAEKSLATARSDCAEHDRQEAAETGRLVALSSVAPSFFARLFRTSAWRAHERAIREQVARLNALSDAARDAKTRLAVAIAEQERHSAAHRAALQASDAFRQEAVRLTRLLQRGRSETGGELPVLNFWALPDDELQRAAPWNVGDFRAARDDLFAAAVHLHKAFILATPRSIKASLNTIARAVQGGSGAAKPSLTDWGVFFLLVPVVSTTFASIGRMFRSIGASEIGWLLIDEAGQATPQAAVGAVWRARRAVVIGDPLQIEPVVTTPRRTTRLIFDGNNADPVHWAAPCQSAQTLADRASRIQGHFRMTNAEGGQEVRITGIPLLVHRRCEEPMFGIANRIAYDDRMVFATMEGTSPIRDLLGSSSWIDVDAPSTDKWVEAEGRLIAAAISKLCRTLPDLPDVYVICPFKMPARRLRALLFNTPSILAGLSKAERKTWIENRVGTVHTFQGKEAEAVILMLGAGRGAKAGSRAWAGETPNLLNVDATRAKRVIYLVGNRIEWQDAGVFAEAARTLQPVSGVAWLSADATTTVLP